MAADYTKSHASRFIVKLMEGRHYLLIFGDVFEDDWKRAKFACMMTEANAHKLSQRLFQLRPQSNQDTSEKVELPVADLSKGLWPPDSTIRITMSSCRTLSTLLDSYFQRVGRGEVTPIGKTSLWFDA